MARFSWSNVVVTPNDAMVLETDSGPGIEVLGDLSLSGAYKGTLRLRMFKSALDGFVSISACEFLSFRPAAQAGGGVLGRVAPGSVSEVVSDSTNWFGTPLPGATITGDFQERADTATAYVTQGTLTLVLVLKPGGQVSTGFTFSGAFARTAG